jgi:hypothetical protein
MSETLPKNQKEQAGIEVVDENVIADAKREVEELTSKINVREEYIAEHRRDKEHDATYLAYEKELDSLLAERLMYAKMAREENLKKKANKERGGE